MLLQELANRKMKVSMIRNDDRVLDAEANIGDRIISFSAVYIEGVRNQFWNVMFSERYKDYDDPDDPNSDFQWHDTIDLTGSGNEFEVLSMVTTCLKELLKKNPKEIVFTAKTGGDDSKRASIYRRIASKILKDFELEETNIGNEVEFRYIKK